jgi:hypothetical protein
MLRNRRFRLFAVAFVGSIACMCAASTAFCAESSQRIVGQVSVEPAVDLTTGDSTPSRRQSIDMQAVT